MTRPKVYYTTTTDTAIHKVRAALAAIAGDEGITNRERIAIFKLLAVELARQLSEYGIRDVPSAPPGPDTTFDGPI